MTEVRTLGPGDDIEMMKTPDHWPNRFLPLTRRPAQLAEDNPARMGDADLGVLMMNGQPTVYLGNMFLLTSESIKYDDFEAIYAAGWRVD
jgi:hypothetical protein